MTLIYPATADAFRCIADACRHTCCKGWEIDIDPNTRAKYAAMTGEIGAAAARRDCGHAGRCFFPPAGG